MKEKNQIKCLKSDQPKKEKVKVEILKLVLDAPRTVKEHDVVTHLIDSETIKCQSSVNRHFKDLYDMKCLNKVGSKSLIYLNKWNVTKFETLRKIKEKFPEIHLNKYEKSIMIVLKEFKYNLNSIEGLNFYIRLHQSVSFFNICLDTDIDTLSKRAWDVYLSNEGFENDQLLKRLLSKFYYTHVKDNPKIEMSEEAFQEVVKEMEQIGGMEFKHNFFGLKVDPASEFFRKKFAGLEIMMSKDILMKIESEALQRMDESPIRKGKWNDTFDEEDIRLHETIFENVCEKLYKENNSWGKLSLEKFKKVVNEDRKLHVEIDEISSLIEKQRETFKESGFGLQLRHFLNHDILIGASPDEEFEKKVKEIESNLRSKYDNSVGYAYSGDCMYNLLVLRIAIEFILKYKQPKIFCVPDDKIAIFKYLLKFYAYPLELSGFFIEEKGNLKSLLKFYGLKDQEL